MSQTESKDEAAAPPAEGAPPAPATPTEVKSTGRSLFTYKGFNALFAGSFTGTLGDRLYQASLIASAIVIFYKSDAPRNVALIQIVATVPGLLLYFASGSLIDSCDRRRLMTLIKAIKIFMVLLLVPLLWNVAQLDPKHIDPELQSKLKALWPICLAVVVLLNIVTVPFAPARAAAIPDVAPEEHRSLGASLMATTGLISLLVGTYVGGELASSSLGPARTILISSALYAIAAFLLSRLPDAAAVPGNHRAKTGPPEEAVPEAGGVRAYVSGLYEGLVYCLKRPNILGLIYFETVFWTVGSAFYVLILVHAEQALHLSGNDETRFFSRVMGCAGLGLFGGAIGVGKICRRVSPIVTYTPAFVLISIGMFAVFTSSVPVDSPPPSWIYAAMFALGLGGGLVLGRVDADVLATTDAEIRGRVFSVKAMVFAATILITMLTITEAGLSADQKKQLIHWMPIALFISLPIVFILSWIIDIAIWSKRGDPELPGPFHRFGYRLVRFTGWTLFKILFRYEIQGEENIPRSGPVVLAANHGSFIDPFLLGCGAQRQVQYIIYSSYYRSLGHPFFRFLRCIPVDEKDHLGALKASVRSLSQGACIGIFPEGRITYDGKLQPPQRGALFLAQRAGAAVVPVALKGNYEAWPRTNWLPRLSKITVIYGKPFQAAKDLSKKETADLSDKLMADIAAMLGKDPPPKAPEKDVKT